jgi:bifunctional oligoribonuclease and PAP phosphatase NrnA
MTRNAEMSPPRYDVGSPIVLCRASRLASLSLQEEIVPIRSVPDDVGNVPPDDLRAAAALVRAASSVTVICHENPDADTLGGGLALACALERLGITTEVVCATGWPSTLAFLPHVDRVRRSPGLASDAIILVDCASIDRAGPVLARWIRESVAAVLVNVDHHVSNDGYGTASCIDHSAAATSEVVARLLGELDCTPDREMATLLLAGILHDTDGLRVPETSASTLRLTAELMDAGADIAAITRQLFARRPLAALRLWGGVASTLETAIDGRVVIGTVTNEMLTATGAVLLDAEDLPELVASAQGADVALLLRQLSPAETRVSIRTTGSVDAAAMAMEFGGGGHGRAGGCTIAAGIGEARARLLSACERHLQTVGHEPLDHAAPPQRATHGEIHV